MILTPHRHAIIVPALMQPVEVWPWCLSLGNPGVGDDAHIGVAGELLPEHLDAVIFKDGQISSRTKSSGRR